MKLLIAESLKYFGNYGIAKYAIFVKMVRNK